MNEFLASLTANPGHLWLMAGAVLVAVEILFITGMGFLFAGLAAFTVGTAIAMEWLPADATAAQAATFLLMTALWAVILWKPLKKWLKTGTDEAYSNIIGNSATVESPGLEKGKTGTVRWSGTLMKAQIDHGCAHHTLAPGTEVRITAVKGNTLTVTR